MFLPRSNKINAFRVNTAVAEHVRKMGNIFIDYIERRGEQMAKIMGKNLAGIDTRIMAQRFHLTPYIRATYGFSVFGDEYRTRFDAVTGGVGGSSISAADRCYRRGGGQTCLFCGGSK